MKILQKTGFTFAPASRTLDFTGLSGFDIRGLFVVINLAAGVPIYVASADGLGYTGLNGSKVTLAADTSSMAAGDPLLVLYDDGSAPASAPLQTAGNTLLSSILSAIQAQIDFESSVWTDGTSYFVRRETANEGTGAITIIYTDPAGATVTPPSGIRPVASDNAIQLLTSLFDVKTAGTGYSVGDQLSRIVAVNKATNPPAASSAIWLNMTTGAVIAAPAAANIAETDQNVTATLAAGTASIGAVTNLALGAPADAVATSDTGTFSLVALTKRALGYLATLAGTVASGALKAAIQSNSPRVTATGALGAANATVSLALDGMNTGVVQITGTWAGTVSWLGSVDGGATYNAVNMIPYGGGAASTNSTTVNGVWELACGGLTHLQVQMSAYTSGSATVLLTGANGLKSIRVGNQSTFPLNTADVVPAAIDNTYGPATSATNALAANPKRAAVYVYNPNTFDVMINFRGAATTTAATAGNIVVKANGGDWRSPTGMCPKTAMSIIAGTAGGVVTIMEGTSP